MKIRVGMGYDVHQLVEGRDLWMGGIKLEHSKGLSIFLILPSLQMEWIVR